MILDAKLQLLDERQSHRLAVVLCQVSAYIVAFLGNILLILILRG